MNLRWPALNPWELAMFVGVLAQVMKFAIYGAANRRVSLRALVTTNGFPSLYAVVFGCLSTAVALDLGVGAPLSIACIIFTVIILHDTVRVKGSVDLGGRAALLVAQSLSPPEAAAWEKRILPLLGDRRHRPLHIAIGLVLGVLAGFGWHPR